MILISFLKKIIATVFVFLFTYFFFVFYLGYSTANRNFVEDKSGVEIFLVSNGVHTDIVVPADNSICNWRKKINYHDFKNVSPDFKYIAMGWGDKGFYLNTPQWSDLKFSTAFNAAFCLSTSAMHVTCRSKKPNVGENTKSIYISNEQYKKLCDFILQSFKVDGSTGGFLIISDSGYGANDNFYDANGTYSLFYTCNVWANEALKQSGIKCALWAPFDFLLLSHY
jgi:uncharacterized protein (TIGR02117 family)